MTYEEGAISLSHDIFITYLLRSLARSEKNPIGFLEELEHGLISNLPNLKTIKEGPDELENLVAERISILAGNAAIAFRV